MAGKKNTLEKQMEELTSKFMAKLDDLHETITTNHNKLTEALERIRNTELVAERALSLAIENEEKINIISKKTDVLQAKLNETESANQILTDQLDDQINRNLRCTLIFKGIMENEHETSYEATASILANTIAKIDPTLLPEDIIKNIDRAHRTAKNKNRNTVNSGPRPIIAKFLSWKYSQDIIKRIIQNNRSSTENKVFVTQMYSPRVTARINEALKYRKEILKHDNTKSMYVAYPAKLMGKDKGTKEPYKLVKSF